MGKIILAIAIGVLGLPVAAYVMGRILLPEIGLSAPGYWTWFWVNAIGVIVYSIVRGLQSALLD